MIHMEPATPPPAPSLNELANPTDPDTAPAATPNSIVRPGNSVRGRRTMLGTRPCFPHGSLPMSCKKLASVPAFAMR